MKRATPTPLQPGLSPSQARDSLAALVAARGSHAAPDDPFAGAVAKALEPRNVGSFAGELHLKRWVSLVAARDAVSEHRELSRQRRFADGQAAQVADRLPYGGERAEQVEALHERLAKLPALERFAVERFYLLGKTDFEIGTELFGEGVKPPTRISRSYRLRFAGLGRLQRELAGARAIQ
jgi:DNA-directed RNA polymerase specialized sigma24 family protein